MPALCGGVGRCSVDIVERALEGPPFLLRFLLCSRYVAHIVGIVPAPGIEPEEGPLALSRGSTVALFGSFHI